MPRVGDDRSRRATRAAVVAAAAHIPVGALLWWFAFSSDRGDMEELVLLPLGAGLILISGWVTAVAVGLWRDRSWARTAALITFLLAAAGSTIALIDTAGRLRGPDLPFGAPRRHLVAPTAVLVGSAAVVVLIVASRARPRDGTRREGDDLRM